MKIYNISRIKEILGESKWVNLKNIIEGFTR
jgi:hypothetical protein